MKVSRRQIAWYEFPASVMRIPWPGANKAGIDVGSREVFLPLESVGQESALYQAIRDQASLVESPGGAVFAETKWIVKQLRRQNLNELARMAEHATQAVRKVHAEQVEPT